MTQEEKQLLLKDLCARLLYGVRMKGVHEDFELSTSTSSKRLSYVLNNTDFKPYLRPMSSMDGAEVLEYLNLKESTVASDGISYFFETYESIDWLNSRHFDYRGLIGKGLALEAPEGMYA